MRTVTPLGSPAPTFVYDTNSNAGAGGGTYAKLGSSVIHLGDIAAGQYVGPYGTNNPLGGIDTFAYVVRHESQHYKDFVDLWGNNYTDWATNHVGNIGPGDDKDGEKIPNRIEDVNLNGTYEIATDLYDWQIANTPTAGRPTNITNDFEDWDCQRNKTVKGNHKQDWANPGMQHGVNDVYNN